MVDLTAQFFFLGNISHTLTICYFVGGGGGGGGVYTFIPFFYLPFLKNKNIVLTRAGAEMVCFG